MKDRSSENAEPETFEAQCQILTKTTMQKECGNSQSPLGILLPEAAEYISCLDDTSPLSLDPWWDLLHL
jgi:hypothetical protein